MDLYELYAISQDRFLEIGEPRKIGIFSQEMRMIEIKDFQLWQELWQSKDLSMKLLVKHFISVWEKS